MDELTQKVVEMREGIPPMTFPEIGKILDISKDAAWRRYRKVKAKRPTAVEPGKENLSKERPDANNLQITYTGNKDRIKTLEELLVAANVDPNVWEVERWVANKWEVAGKFGTKGRESFELQDLWQVKAWLIRKNPVAIDPVIQPVKLKIKLPPKKKIKRGSPERAVVLAICTLALPEVFVPEYSRRFTTARLSMCFCRLSSTSSLPKSFVSETFLIWPTGLTSLPARRICTGLLSRRS